MRTITVLLCLLFLMGGLCFGPTAPAETLGTTAVARLLRHIKLVKARAREARRSSSIRAGKP